jgi:predicted phosphoadenosine phosphosulfate sulfurtransferase
VAGEWLCLPVKHRNACSRRHPWWYPWAPEAEDKWVRPLPPEAIQRVPGFPIWPAEDRLTTATTNGLLFDQALGNCAFLFGVRAQESLRRMQIMCVASKGRDQSWIPRYGDSPTNRGNLWKAYQVYDWKTEDVWTAPAQKGWDYNRAYDRFEMAGIGHSSQRCSPAFREEPILGLDRWAKCFPEVWEKMTDRVPSAAAAARYSRTELYGFRSRPEKPPGMTWPEFIIHYLAKHDSAAVAKVAGRVKTFTKTHYSKTTTPIAATTHYPITGVSWDFLLTIAMRGDFKGRRSSTTKVLSPVQAAADRSGKRPSGWRTRTSSPATSPRTRSPSWPTPAVSPPTRTR